MSKHRVLQCLLAASMLSTGGLGISTINVLAEEGVDGNATDIQSIRNGRVSFPVTVKPSNKSEQDSFHVTEKTSNISEQDSFHVVTMKKSNKSEQDTVKISNKSEQVTVKISNKSEQDRTRYRKRLD